MRDLLLAFIGAEEVSILVPTVSQVTAVESNQYATRAHFGVACSGPLH